LFIHSKFQDGNLSPAAVAGHFSISVNYLHKLFAKENITFGAFVRRSRLARASNLLADPRENLKSISEIAYSTGFNDLSHFYRLFKEKHGMPPGAYQAIHTNLEE
ncbi:MAG: helix-turn-helix transcriptional regulator, partial [Chloroflexota bacterium]